MTSIDVFEMFEKEMEKEKKKGNQEI